MITTQYMTSFTPEEMKLMVEQGAAKDARIAELEQQLAAAQERERIFRAEADYYLAYIYRGIFEDERERGEFEDDAIRIANNIMASLKQSALAAAQKGSAPASDGEQEGAGE